MKNLLRKNSEQPGRFAFSGISPGRENQPAIEVKNLTRYYGSFAAVNQINFAINRAEIVAFLGPNGAGKTTTIKMLTGLLRPTSGQALILGYDVLKNLNLIKNLIGYMSQRFSLYPLLTAAVRKSTRREPCTWSPKKKCEKRKITSPTIKATKR